MTEPRRHLGGLDGLRGIAVLAVLLFHDERLSGGFLGVDLFFALSGFLITGLLLEERAVDGRIDLARFWERRARRLLPAVLLLLAVVTPLMYRFGTPSQVSSARHDVLPAMFYVANWAQIADSRQYWAIFSDPSPLVHLWSLAVEEQFYLVWPVVALLCLRGSRGRVRLASLSAAGTVVSFALMLVLFDPASPSRVYLGTDTRAASILVGALAAAVALDERIVAFAGRRPHLVLVAQIAMLVMLLAAWIAIDGESDAWLYRGGLLAHSSICAVLVASMTVQPRTPVMALLELRPLRWVGLVSYGLYLWHWPVYIVIDEGSTGWSRPAVSIVRWAVSLAVAAASYHVLEAPIRYRRALRAAPAAFGALAVAVALTVAAVALTPRRGATELSIEPSLITLPTTPAVEPGVTSTVPSVPVTAAGDGAEAPAGTQPEPSDVEPARRAVATVLWEGDSVAFDSAPGVLAALQASGVAADGRTVLGVGLVERDDVHPMALYVDPYRDAPPDLVVLMLSGWDDAFDPEVQQDAFDRYADAWASLGTALVVTAPPPVDPTRHDPTSTDTMLAIARRRAAEHPAEVTVLDADQLWGEFATDMDGDGQPERKPDGVHVCPTASALLGYWLSVELAERFDDIEPAPPAEWVDGDWVADPRYDNPPGACEPAA